MRCRHVGHRPPGRRPDKEYVEMKKRNARFGYAVALGVGIGTALGVAMDNLGAGLGIGLALGIVFALAAERRQS